MYKILKYNWNDRHKHYWVSDLHTFHDPSWDVPIWKMRGYESAEDCAQKQKEEINSRVGPTDYLWNLGDNFLNSTDEKALEWWSGINCKNIRYLFGNHESVPYRLYRKAVKDQFGFNDLEVYPVRLNNVVFMGNHLEIRLGKQHIVMNHFPLRTHNKGARGSWQLHGHSHNSDETRNPDHPLGKVLDCGWDWKKSVWSFEEISDVMSTKDIHITDHKRNP